MRRGLILMLFLLSLNLVSAEISVKSALSEITQSHSNKDPVLVVYGDDENYNDFLAAAIISSSLAGVIDKSYKSFPKVLRADEVIDYVNKSLILIGGPCANTISSQLLTQPGYTCKDWNFKAGNSFVKVIKNGNKHALVVAGSSDKDTVRIARAIKSFESSLKLEESDEVYYSRAISVKEAFDQILKEYSVRDDLIIVTSNEKGANDLDVALEISEMILEKSGKDVNFFPRIESASDVKNPSENNLILIGGPCANSVLEDITNEKGFNCRDWKLGESEALIRVTDNGEKIALIIAGTKKEDTLKILEAFKNIESDSRFENSDEIVVDSFLSVREVIKKFDSMPVSIVVGKNSLDYEAAELLKNKLENATIFTDDQEIPKETVIVSIGGPCANDVSEELTEKNMFNCNDWAFDDTYSVVKSAGKETPALMIAGTSKEATNSIVNNLDKISSQKFSHLSEVILKEGGLVDVLELKVKKPACSGFFCRIKGFFTDKDEEIQYITEEKLDYNEYLSTIDSNPNCYECFLEHQSRDYVFEIVRVLSSRETNDDFEEGERRYVLGKITENKELVCSALDKYNDYLENNELSFEDELVVYENILFLSTECLSKRYQYFYLSKILDLIDETGFTWKENVYVNLLTNEEYDIDVKPVKIKRSLDVPRKPKKIIIGESFIEVDSGDVIGVQVERAVRDWFSINIDRFPNTPPDFKEKLGPSDINYMEGNILRRIVKISNASAEAIPNTLVVGKKGPFVTKWYSMDEKGKFRFEILSDKVQYPTTKCVKNICLLVDTHGISSLVAKAVKHNLDLVMGCGDYYGKMDGAYYLASKGINVLYPTDRFASEMIGYEGVGMSLGSAPVKENGNKAIIGDQPIEIDPKETIVVQTTNTGYPAQYYDAPEKYFKSLEKLSGVTLKLVSVDNDNIKQTYKVIDKAKELGAKVVGIRVGYDEDYPAVRDWLAESSEHRAVLFHSSGYEAGFKILEEFPDQTSFGDPYPRFE